MTRNAIVGALVFGAVGALSGYLWTAFEFPFAILLVAAVGWYAVVRPEYGSRKAWQAAAVGGVTFTTAFLVGVFFALTDGSPLALAAWMTSGLAAGAAGAFAGAVLDKGYGAAVMALYSAGGMLAGVVLAGILRAFAPGAVDVEGPVQAAYFALAIGIVAAASGAAIGAGVSWLRRHDRRHAGVKMVSAH